MTKKKPNLKLRQYRNLLLLLFLIMILIVPLVHLALPDREFSAVENRALKQPPAFSMAALQDGSYKKDLTSYMEDQFPFRDQMIRLKAGIEKLLGRQENNDVYIRSTEYLMDKFNPNSKELTKEKAEVLNAFAKAHPAQKVSLMLVPNKIEILKDRLPPYAPTDSQADYLDELYSQLSPDINTINLIPRFTDLKNNYLFFKSDHHWTQTGAFRAQEAFFESINMTPRLESEFDVRKVAQDFLGTLTAKSGIPTNSPDELNLYVPKAPEDLVVNLTEEQKKLTSLYQMDLVDGQDKYLVYLGGNYPVVRISTTSTKDRRLLIIKDSYANAFVPFMTKDFNEITMVDLRYYTGDVNELVDEYLITDLLILYNINTFNDDHSILNIGDSLAEPRVSINRKPVEPTKDLSLTTRFDPYAAGNLLVTLRNTTKDEIAYQRRIDLEIKEGDGWKKLSVNPSYEWENKARTLGPSANAEYMVRIEEAFGELKPATYRVIQSYDQTKTASVEFTIDPNPLLVP